MMKKRVFLLLLLIPEMVSAQRRASVKPASKLQHRWGINTALLIQDAPLRELSVFEAAQSTWYVQQNTAWIAGKAGFGFSLGASYDITFPNRGVFRLQFQLESTGWISGVIDIGGGLRTALRPDLFLSIEGYFSFAQTGGTLAKISDHNDKRTLYVAQFGVKVRLALEFTLKNKWFIAPYLSYAAYPWSAATGEPYYINGVRIGAISDSLQIGFEFGRKY